LKKLVLGLLFTFFLSSRCFASNDVFECHEFTTLFTHVLSKIDTHERFHFQEILERNVREFIREVNISAENYSLSQFCENISPYLEENPTVFFVQLTQAVLEDMDKYSLFKVTREVRSQYQILNGTHAAPQNKQITHQYFGNILYIKINGFFKEKDQNNNDISIVPTYIKNLVENSPNLNTQGKIIIDLRGNQGGSTVEATRTVDLFLPENLRVMTYHLRGAEREGKIDTITPQLILAPVDILVNRDTASSAEILAGALQHYGRARILGEKTYGKTEIVQELELIKDLNIQFDAKVRYTYGRYWIAENISATDLKPDIYLENPDAPIEELLEIINH